jgi:EAL domain-containing protein (putative c-di-GMP-specific phosphodiesterase class I)/GGDEF domain-containing protein
MLTAGVAAVSGLIAFGLGMGGTLSLGLAAAVVVVGHAAVACVAATNARAASRASSGVSARVWRLFAIGLGLWLVGCGAYVTFLALDGSPQDPAAWTQIGFLLAYVPWYRALWLMRQPVLGRGRRQRWESVLVELAALGLLTVVLGAGLWSEDLAAGQNLALLLPGVLDLLLLAGLYNAVRRSRLTFGSAHSWLALAFLGLAVTDTAVTAFVPRGHFNLAGLALTGYAVALGFLGTACTRPLRLAETRRGVGRSSAAVGLLSLALVAPAAALLPAQGRIAVWVVGGLLLAWLWSRVALDNEGDIDSLTGMLRLDALQRHLSGVLALASEERPAGLIVFEMHGLAEWTERHGFREADALLRNIGTSLEDIDLPEGGVWSHLSPARFAWLGVTGDAESGRRLALRIRDAGGMACAPLDSRCGVALVPGDAETPEDALAAAFEAAATARSAGRAVVLFDRGLLDGLPTDATYGTSMRARRARIVEIIESESLLEPVFQPIVDLERGTVRGYEALSRFHAEPRQGPDAWIAEAHLLGLGIELEAECIRRAVAKRSEAPAGRYLSLNASPELLLSPLLEDALADQSLLGIVLEITEHQHVSDYAELSSKLALLRGRGAQVAIDDVGAGHSSMRHVMNLRPDMIKVDRWMVTDINVDSGKRALVRSFVALSIELGADLVIEGVETVEELAALRELGAGIAQGYLFARPDREFGEATVPAPVSAAHPVAPVAAGAPILN